MSPPPALLIFDIMSLILQYVGDNKGTMLALGLTCHKLLEPMLDEIWRHLDKAPALLSLADLQWPLSTPKTTLSKFCASKRRTSRAIKRNWTRFDYYAKRIQVFGHPIVERYKSSAMYTALCQLRPGVVPLPALRMIQVVESDCNVNKVPLADTIRTFDMVFTQSDGGDWAGVAAVATKIPLLETFIISGVIPPRMQTLSSEFSHLRHLDLRWAISKEDDVLQDIMHFVHSIANQETVTELHLPMTKPSKQSVEQHFGAFSSLESINITEASHIAAHIFHALGRNNIRYVNVADSDDTLSNSQKETPSYNPTHQWNACFESIRSSFQSLVSIAIYSAVLIDPANIHQDPATLTDVIRPLLELKTLRDFKIKMHTFHGGYIDSIHDGLVSAIASAWPNLRVLVLDIVWPMCFHCMGEFANVCPMLEKLDVNVCFQDRRGHSAHTWTKSQDSVTKSSRLDLRVFLMEGSENPHLEKEAQDLLSDQFSGTLRSLHVACNDSTYNTAWLRPAWA